MAVELKVRPSGESIVEVSIGQWLKSPGERVERDDIVAELDTDKASLEVPAPASGTIRILKQAGETAQIGEVIAYIDEVSAATTAPPEKPAEPEPAAAPAEPPPPHTPEPPVRDKGR